MKRRTIVGKLTAALFWLVAFGICLSVYAQTSKTQRMEVFEQVWQTISEKYYDPNFNGVNWQAIKENYRPRAEKASDEKNFYLVLDQMAGELRDSHTRVYSPAQREQRLKNQRAGVGLKIRMIAGVPMILSVAPNSEAWRAGVRAGMALLSVNSLPIEKSLAEAHEAVGISSSKKASEMRVLSKILSGEPNTALTLELEDVGHRKLKISLTRQAIAATPPFEARFISPQIGYLRFTRFDETIERQIKEALDLFKNTRGLILDLRENGGGDGETGLRVAGYFLNKKIAVARIVTRNGQPLLPEIPMMLEAGAKDSQIYRQPLVILTDEGTASVSELIANSLQEQNRARIFGTNSCGCVLAFLNYQKLKDGGEMTLSEFDFVTATGKRLEGIGVIPDKMIKLTRRNLINNQDAALKAAREYLENL